MRSEGSRAGPKEQQDYKAKTTKPSSSDPLEHSAVGIFLHSCLQLVQGEDSLELALDVVVSGTGPNLDEVAVCSRGLSEGISGCH